MAGGRASGGLLTVLLVLAAVATALPGPVTASGHTAPPPPEQTFNVSDRVHAWERGGLPLRADSDAAAIALDNADWRVRNGTGGETSLNRDPITAYAPGATVGLDFDAARANVDPGSFDGTGVQVVAAHVDESADASVPDSFSDALDLVSEDTANGNASYEELSARTLDDSGTASFEYTPDEAGIHVVFVAVNETGPGFSVSDGALSVESNVTVVGAERLLVRESAGAVTTPGPVEPGTTAEFDVDASDLNGSSVTHSLVVYDDSTYRENSFVVNLTSPVAADFDAEADSRLLTSVATVNGEASVGAGVSVLGADPDDGYVTRTGGPASLLDFVAEGAAGTADADAREGATETLNASVTVRDGDPVRTIRIETSGDDGNWSPTPEYRWVYVGVGADSREMLARTGTLNVTVLPPGPDEGGGDGETGDGGENDTEDTEPGGGDDDDDGNAGVPPSGGGGGGGGSTGGDTSSGGGQTGGGGGGGTEPIAPPTSDAGDDEPDSGIRTNVLGGATVLEIASVNASEPVTVSLDRTVDTVARQELFTVEQQTLNFTAPAESGRVRVADAGSDPGEVPPLDRPRAFGYVEITDRVPDSEVAEASVTFSLPAERRQQAGVPPAGVTMYRYHNDSWDALDTDHLGGQRYRATMPGLSVFSVGAPAGIETARLDATTVEPGESVVVTAQVTNADESSTSLALQLATADRQLIRRSVDLAGGETRNVTLTTFVDEPGSYQLSLNGREVDELTVEAADTADQTAVETADGDERDRNTPPAGGERTTAPGDGGPADVSSESSGVTTAPPLASIAVALVVVLVTVVLARRWFDL